MRAPKSRDSFLMKKGVDEGQVSHGGEAFTSAVCCNWRAINDRMCPVLVPTENDTWCLTKLGIVNKVTKEEYTREVMLDVGGGKDQVLVAPFLFFFIPKGFKQHGPNTVAVLGVVPESKSELLNERLVLINIDDVRSDFILMEQPSKVQNLVSELRKKFNKMWTSVLTQADDGSRSFASMTEIENACARALQIGSIARTKKAPIQAGSSIEEQPNMYYYTDEKGDVHGPIQSQHLVWWWYQGVQFLCAPAEGNQVPQKDSFKSWGGISQDTQ